MTTDLHSQDTDVGRVLEYIGSLGDNKVSTLKDLTHKLATIMALANASRAFKLAQLTKLLVNVRFLPTFGGQGSLPSGDTATLSGTYASVQEI